MTTKVTDVEAECEVRKVPKTIGGDEFKSMVDAFKNRW